MSAVEIAAELGTTRQTVERIISSALAKCRTYCTEHGLRLEDLLDPDQRGGERRWV